MQRKDQVSIGIRIVVDRPVIGVSYSLQSRDNDALDARISKAGEALSFDFSVKVSPGPKFSGDQVRREGPERRFVYIRVGQLAGDLSSAWSRRIKVDIHDINPSLLTAAATGHRVVELTITGTGRDGTPACATVRPSGYRLA